MFGGPGDDHLEGGFGRDTVDGGPGNDRVFGNQDPDRLEGGEGGEGRISGVDGTVDRISCGPGRDLVIADADDVIARDCESVRR